MEAFGRPLESCPLASTRLAGAGNNASLNVSIFGELFLNIYGFIFCERILESIV